MKFRSFFAIKWWVWICWWAVWVNCNFFSENTIRRWKRQFIIPSKPNDVLSKCYRLPIKPTIRNTFIFGLEKKWISRSAGGKERLDEATRLFKENLEKANISFVLLHIYAHGFEGFSAAFSEPKEIRKVEEMNLDFIAVIMPDRLYTAQSQIIMGKQLYEKRSITKIPLDYMKMPDPRDKTFGGAEGVTVAVLDGGIRFTESAFTLPQKRCQAIGDEGCRVKKVLDFVAAENRGWSYQSNSEDEPLHDGVTDVYSHHGTMMAGLIGGTSKVAPGIAQVVEFHDYRIIDDNCNHSRVLAAIAIAIKNKVDIISLSLASGDGSFFWLMGPLLKPTELHEIILTVSNGNLGLSGMLFQVNDIGNSNGVMSVGCFSSPLIPMLDLDLKLNAKEKRPETFFVRVLRDASFDYFDHATNFPFLFANLMKISSYSATPLYTTFQKFFMIVKCFSSESCLSVARSMENDQKVLGVFFICGIDLPSSLFNTVQIPVGQFTDFTDEYETILENLHSTFGMLHLSLGFALNKSPEPARISSLGPSIMFQIKPDFSAIGCRLRVFVGGLAAKDRIRFSCGTSNANAIATGVFALDIAALRTKKLITNTADLLIRIQNTAQPYFIDENDFHLKGLAYSVLQQGAGLIQVRPIFNPGVKIIPSKLELGSYFPTMGVPNHFTFIKTLKLSNTSPDSIEYSLIHSPAVALCFSFLKNNYLQETFKLHAKFQINGFTEKIEKLLVHKEFAVSLDVILEIDHTIPPFTFLSGFLQFIPRQRPNSDKKAPFGNSFQYSSLSVPYQLYYGDIDDFPIILSSGEKASFLTNSKMLFFSSQVNPFRPIMSASRFYPIYHHKSLNVRYTMREFDRPILCLCLFAPVKYIVFHLFTYELNNNLGWIRGYKNLPPQCNYFLYKEFEVPEMGKYINSDLTMAGWDGKYIPFSNPDTMEKAPRGNYRICVKAFLHLEVEESSTSKYNWCSVAFTLEYLE